MRYREDHAAKSGSVPLPLRGRKSARVLTSVAVAAAIGVVPALVYSAPAVAAAGDLHFDPVVAVTEGGNLLIPYSYGGSGTPTYTLTATPVGTRGATAVSDFTLPVSLDLSQDPTSGNITIPTIQDNVYEGPEQFLVTADDGAGDTESATLTINDGDAAPTLSVTGPIGAVLEPGSPSAYSTGVDPEPISVGLTLANGTTSTQYPTVVTLNSYDGTATSASGDYDALSNVSYSFSAGSTWTNHDETVNINGDATKDSATDEQFTVVGTSPDVAASKTATVHITDNTADQVAPKLTLTGPTTHAENTAAPFVITADHASDTQMSAVWSSADTTPAANHGVATVGTDFTYPATAAGRTVNIAAGATTQSFNVQLLSDAVYDPDEDYTISLGTPTNADLGTTTTVKSTITDATGTPAVTITPATVAEGNTGSTPVTFTATLSPSSTQTVTANWATTDGSAKGGADFVRNSGTLTFAPGVTTQTFTVNILGDTVDEGTGEDFSIDLKATDGTSMGSQSVTITDDDSPPTISFGNLKVDEGNAPSAVLVPIKLSSASGSDIHLNVTTAGGGTAGALTPTVGQQDYSLLNSVATIPAGATTGYVAILINGDDMYERDETVNLSATVAGPDQAYLTAPFTATSTVTIANDDPPPTLAINDVTGKEGDTVSVTGTVQGSSYIDTVLSVVFTGQAANGMKAADTADFTNPGAVQVLIPAGTVTGDKLDVAKVTLTDDTAAEGDESIVVSGVGVGNIGMVKNGVITIAANDGGKPNEPGTGKLTIMAPKNIVGAVAVPIKGMAAADSTVDLWGAPMGAGGELKKLLSTKADAKGNYMFSRWIGEGYRFAVSSGDDKSDEVMVTVTQNPVFVASSTRKGVLALAVQGNPRESGQTAIVQRLVGGKWVNSWRGTTGSDNIWRGAAKVASGSKVTVRAFVAGYTPDGLLPGYSAAKTITIK
jgi:hypothetical protein